jgi:hypothetical protein
MQAKPESWKRAIAFGCSVCALAPATHAESAKAKPDPAGEKMTLEGGQEGTSLPSLTIEGEDRIRIEFDRPGLEFDLDPRSTQGLELGETVEILDREPLDLVHPMLEVSARARTPYLGRGWLDELRSGPVARFRPNLKGVERWSLAIADSRGQTVREFAGNGSPPQELEWDGVTASGAPALPGLTYSYALEAYDRAGNKRNFVGEGFEVGAYRVETPDALIMLFSGKEVQALAAGRAAALPPAIVLEVASWINQAGRLEQPIRVQTTARSYELANALTKGIAQHLSALVIGDAVRIQPLATVEPDAPQDGTVAVTLAP